MYDKYQATSYNFRLGFALSNRHHLHRAYLVTVRFHLILSVYLVHEYTQHRLLSLHNFKIALVFSANISAN